MKNLVIIFYFFVTLCSFTWNTQSVRIFKTCLSLNERYIRSSCYMYSCSCLVGLKFLVRFASNLGEIFGARRILVFNLRKLLTRNQNFFSLGELKTPPGSFSVYERRVEARHNAWEASVWAAYIVIFTSRTIYSASMKKRLIEYIGALHWPKVTSVTHIEQSP